jgi:hypothetical protein
MKHPILERMRTCVSHLVALTIVGLTSPTSLFMSADITHIGPLLLQKGEDCQDSYYNAITTVMVHFYVDIRGAVQWVSDRHEEVLVRFWELREKVINKDDFPSWGPELDRPIIEYTDVFADHIRGNYEWSWHTQR